MAVAGSVVLLAMAILAWSTMTTASAGFVGSTSTENSLFRAATVDLEVGAGAGSSTSLRLDADGLYPGLVVERCLLVSYRGTLSAGDVRLHGVREDGSGLEPYLRTQVELGSGRSADCADFRAATTVFTGTLDELWQRHGTFADGLVLMPAAADGDSLVVRFRAEVESDDRAQGLTTRFSFVFEARP